MNEEQEREAYGVERAYTELKKRYIETPDPQKAFAFLARKGYKTDVN